MKLKTVKPFWWFITGRKWGEVAMTWGKNIYIAKDKITDDRLVHEKVHIKQNGGKWWKSLWILLRSIVDKDFYNELELEAYSAQYDFLKNQMLTIGISISDHFTTPWLFTQSMIRTISKYPNTRVLTAHGSLIAENRNYLYKNCVSDYLLMIDTDIVFTDADVENLLNTMKETKANICLGVYREGYPPNELSLFDEEFNHPKELKAKPFEVHAGGAGFMLINMKTVRLGENPFDQIIDSDIRRGEDVSFCLRAKRNKLKIVADPNVKVGHLRLKELCV